MSVEVSIILRCIRPHLSDETVPVLQKRVYFCLLRICHYHAPFIVSTMLAEFSSLLMESILTLNIVSKRYRLKCLFFVCKALSAQNPEHIQFCMSLLPEVILCLKDASKKVRAICYDLIVLFAELMRNSSVAYELPDHTQAQASLQQFLVTLTACLVSENPHMQAAALMSISCVVNHFRGEEALRDVELRVLQLVYSLIKENNRELVKACLKYIQKCVRVLGDDDLAAEKANMVQAVMVDCGGNKNRYRARVAVKAKNDR